MGLVLLLGTSLGMMVIAPATAIWSARYAVPVSGPIVAAAAIGAWLVVERCAHVSVAIRRRRHDACRLDRDSGQGWRRGPARCLGAIRAQALDHEPEVVVVDSGSTDGSVATAREYGARVLEIPPEEFDHGATRNLAAEAARGEVLVFISQDAEPVGDGWLAALTAPLADERVAGVYGRQVARPDAVPPEAFFLDFVYGPEPRVQELITGRAPSMETTLFSNVNSAIRRSAWEAFPFANDLIMSEDQDWSRRAMEAGWRIVYEPRAVVRHSHVYSIGSAFRRFFDSGVSSEQAYLAGEAAASRVLRRAAAAYLRAEIGWLVRAGRAHWIRTPSSTKRASWQASCSARHRRLPLGLKRRLSAMPSYWNRAGAAGRGRKVEQDRGIRPGTRPLRRVRGPDDALALGGAPGDRSAGRVSAVALRPLWNGLNRRAAAGRAR